MIRVSASQIETFRLCARKWAFSRPEHLGPRSGPSAELGTRVHAMIESWTRDAVPLDTSTHEGQIAAAGLHLLPRPGVGIAEGECRIERGDVVYTGRIDHELPPEGDDLPTIIDYKTTSDLKWAKTEVELRENVQCAIYALYAMNRHGTTSSRQRWIYLHTLRPRSRLVEIVMHRHEAEAVLELADETAREISRHVGLLPHAVPPTATACGAFGGCPYQAECGLTANERLGAIMSQATLAERIKARQAAAAYAAASASTPETTEAPAETPARQAAEAGAINSPAAHTPEVVETAAAMAEPEPAAAPAGTIAAKLAAKRAPKAQKPAATDTPTTIAPSVLEGPAASIADAAAEAARTGRLDGLAGLRDGFAAAAITGMLSRGYESRNVPEFAAYAYRIADAMIDAREARKA